MKMSAEKMDVAEVLEKALAAFGPNGENWVNRKPSEDSPEHCMLSAIDIEFFTVNFRDCEKCLALAIEKDHGGANNEFIARWNDAPERTWPEVESIFKKAIAADREVRP